MDRLIARFESNKQKVLASPILAKAVLRKPNGELTAIVVFARSPRHEFYWAFRIKSTRSSRRTWKFAGYFGREKEEHTQNFNLFVAHYALVNSAEVISLKKMKAKVLQTITFHADQESLHTDWSAILPLPPEAFKYVRQRTATKLRAGSAGLANWKNWR